MAINSAILTVDFPVGAQYPELTEPALAGDSLSVNDTLHKDGLPTPYKMRPGPLPLGRFVFDGGIPAGDYVIKDLRFTQDNQPGKTVDLNVTIPEVSAIAPQGSVVNVDGTGGQLQVISAMNAEVYWAVLPDGQSYADVDRLVIATGALQAGSSPVLAGQTFTFPKFTNGVFNTTYRMWFGSRNDGIDSPTAFVDFTTTGGGTLPDSLPLIDDGEELVVTIF